MLKADSEDGAAEVDGISDALEESEEIEVTTGVLDVS